MTLDDTGTALASRVGAAALTLNGGGLTYKGNATPFTDALGALTLGAGTSTITATNANLTVASLTRAAASGAALNFSDAGTNTLGTAGDFVKFSGLTNTPNTTSGVLPYATISGINGTELAQTTATGIQPYSVSGATPYVATVSGSAAVTDNIQLRNASDTLTLLNTPTGKKTINSLSLVGTSSLTINSGITLTVISGALFVNGTVTITGGGTLVLGEAIITTTAGSSLTIGGNTVLSGTNLTLAGVSTANTALSTTPATVTLPTANSFTGTTTLAGVTLNLGVNLAIGAGALNLISGSLQASTANGVLLTNATTFNNSTVTLGGSNPLLFTGVTLNGVNNTLIVTNSAPTVFAGVVSGAGNLIVAASSTGTLVLSGANTYTGQTFINGGTVQVQNNAAFGTSANTVANAITVASGATVQILGAGLNVAQTILLNGGTLRSLYSGNNTTNTWSGSVILNAPNTNLNVDVGTTLAVSGIVSGPGNLTKVGVGTLLLSGANTYTGTTMVSAGVLSVLNNNGLGLLTAGVTVGSLPTDTATLQLQNNITVGGKALTLNGQGFGVITGTGAMPQGALSNLSGTNTWAGAVTLNGAVGLTGGTIPLLSGNTSSLIGAGAGTLIITGAVGGTDLTKIGAGAVTLANANTYTGNTTVLGGTLTLSNDNHLAAGNVVISGAAVPGFTAGALVINTFGTLGTGGTSAVTIDQGGTLTLDNTTVNQTRLTNTTKPNVTFNSGILTFLAFNVMNAASSETLGLVTLNSGQSIINSGYTTSQASGTTSTLNIGGGLTRVAGATLNLNATMTAGATTAAAGVVGNGTTATATTSAAHGFSVGQVVTLIGFTPVGFNGTYVITSVPSATTFTFASAVSATSTVAGNAFVPFLAAEPDDQPDLVPDIHPGGRIAVPRYEWHSGERPHHRHGHQQHSAVRGSRRPRIRYWQRQQQ